jgi:hypothetical protein
VQEVPECPNVLANLLQNLSLKVAGNGMRGSFGEQGGYEEAFAVIHLRESTLGTSGVITSHSAKTMRSPTEGVFGGVFRVRISIRLNGVGYLVVD